MAAAKKKVAKSNKHDSQNTRFFEGFATMSRALKMEVMELLEKALNKTEHGLALLEHELHRLRTQKPGQDSKKPKLKTKLSSSRKLLNKKVLAGKKAVKRLVKKKTRA